MLRGFLKNILNVFSGRGRLKEIRDSAGDSGIASTCSLDFLNTILEKHLQTKGKCGILFIIKFNTKHHFFGRFL